jgi:hypothetical protein
MRELDSNGQDEELTQERDEVTATRCCTRKGRRNMKVDEPIRRKGQNDAAASQALKMRDGRIPRRVSSMKSNAIKYRTEAKLIRACCQRAIRPLNSLDTASETIREFPSWMGHLFLANKQRFPVQRKASFLLTRPKPMLRGLQGFFKNKERAINAKSKPSQAILTEVV